MREIDIIPAKIFRADKKEPTATKFGFISLTLEDREGFSFSVNIRFNPGAQNFAEIQTNLLGVAGTGWSRLNGWIVRLAVSREERIPLAIANVIDNIWFNEVPLQAGNGVLTDDELEQAQEDALASSPVTAKMTDVPEVIPADDGLVILLRVETTDDEHRRLEIKFTREYEHLIGEALRRITSMLGTPPNSSRGRLLRISFEDSGFKLGAIMRDEWFNPQKLFADSDARVKTALDAQVAATKLGKLLEMLADDTEIKAIDKLVRSKRGKAARIRTECALAALDAALTPTVRSLLRKESLLRTGLLMRLGQATELEANETEEAPQA